MYEIVIATEQNVFAKNLYSFITLALKELNIAPYIDFYEDKEFLLNEIKNNTKQCQLLFFDLNNLGAKSLKTAWDFKQANKNMRIILIDESPELAIKGYEIEALNFMLKPINFIKLKDIIKNDHEKNFKNQYIALKRNSHIRQIKISDIIYMETQGRKVILHLREKNITFSGKLSNFEKILPKNEFIRCHQGYLLNINEIIELDRTYAFTKSGITIPLSRTYQKDVRELFQKKNENRLLTITGSYR